MKICVICVEKKDYAPKRIMEEGRKRGHDMHITSWLDVVINMDENGIYIGDSRTSFDNFDAIIQRSPSFSLDTNNKKITKKLGTILKLLIEYSKQHGIAILNDKYFTSYQSLDKLAQQFFLFSNNLPGIPTRHFTKAPMKNSFPVVVKTAQGSLGSGVFKVNNQKELERMVKISEEEIKNFIYQTYFPIKCDYRVLIVSGKALGIMKRIARGNEWRTNISLGGIACKASPQEIKKIKSLAEKTAKKMFFDYVGVDLLEYRGNYHIIEVNSLAQFKGFEKAYSEMNVAEKIIILMEKKAKKLAKRKNHAEKTYNKR